MLRSMYAGISGMKNFQTKLDVIGNNIANVNTTGFKKGRITFQDMMSQTTAGAEAPLAGGTRGGINPTQIGLGSQIGSIDTIQTQGNRQTTNRTLDLALEGDGMFVLGEATGDNLKFTRAGNFYLDNEGYIVDSNGQYLLGEPDVPTSTTAADGTTTSTYDGTLDGILQRIRLPEAAESFSIQSDGKVNFVQDGETIVAGQIRLAKFSNPAALLKTGSNMFQYTENAGAAVNGLADLAVPGAGGSASIVSGALEMSNVDLADEFTEMITAQRAFQANTKIITTSDEILQELVNLKR